MRDSPSIGFAARWGSLAVVAWALPFLLYWMFPPAAHAAAGLLPPGHGPWRESGPGQIFVACYVVLIVIVPGVVARGAFLSIRWRSPSPLLIALGLAVLTTSLLWHQISALFWLID
jgi:hypothetical protein